MVRKFFEIREEFTMPGIGFAVSVKTNLLARIEELPFILIC
jgi:hypothetical protein